MRRIIIRLQKKIKRKTKKLIIKKYKCFIFLKGIFGINVRINEK